jgi:phosphoribosylaminoimidazole carboxylase PurE protein
MAEEQVMVVSVVLGSDSDISTMESGLKILEEFGIGYEMRILSAHRTPDDLVGYVREATEKGIQVFIAAAGMSAALPGVIGAHTHLPVIGVPVATGALGGIDALLAISQMPPGVPVATVTIGSPGARNAALLAARILALQSVDIRRKLQEYNVQQRDGVLSKDKKYRREV